MKKFIEKTWQSGMMDTLASLFNSVVQASQTQSPHTYEQESDYEMVFEFLNECVEIKGYADTWKRFERYSLANFLSEVGKPIDDSSKEIFNSFFKGIIAEDPQMAKELLEKANTAPLRGGKEYITEMLIDLNKIYLNETKDDVDYIWKAKPTIVEYFKNEGYLTDNNRPNPYVTYIQLVDNCNYSKMEFLCNTPSTEIFAFLKSFKDEIVSEVLSGKYSYNEETSKYLHTLINFGVDDKKIKELAYTADEDFILENWRAYKADPWTGKDDDFALMVFEKSYKKHMALAVDDDRKYPNIPLDALIQSKVLLSIESFKNAIFTYNQGLIEHEEVTHDSFVRSFENVVEKYYKKLSATLRHDKNAVQDRINKILSDSAALQYFIDYDDGENLPSKHYYKTYRNAINAQYNHLEKSNTEKKIDKLNYFLSFTELVSIDEENKDVLKAIKKEALELLVKSFKDLKEEKSLGLITLLYSQDTKETIGKLLSFDKNEHHNIFYRMMEAGPIQPKKEYYKNKDGSTKKIKSCTTEMAREIMTPLSEYRKRLLELVLLDENFKETVKQLGRAVPKNMIVAFEKEFTQLVVEAPDKYYDIVMKNKSLNKVIFEFSPENNAQIMEKMLSVNMANRPALKNDDDEISMSGLKL